jgi:hypothetical protein
MRLRIALFGLLLLLAPTAPSAQEAGETKVSTPKDLLVVLTLRGKPCGKVTSHQRRGESDYLVTCESGDRYRVYVDEQQRVVVEER